MSTIELQNSNKTYVDEFGNTRDTETGEISSDGKYELGLAFMRIVEENRDLKERLCILENKVIDIEVLYPIYENNHECICKEFGIVLRENAKLKRRIRQIEDDNQLCTLDKLALVLAGVGFVTLIGLHIRN